jgi:DHA1 family multidrug/chloramphenicol efflux transport protein-like MFS transporter
VLIGMTGFSTDVRACKECVERSLMQKKVVLSPVNLLFPIALVLFEFSVYIANDMIQPGMLAVVREFGVSAAWVPSGMTAFLLGGALLPWFVGPLSDHVGRRPVMLGGVGFFIASCLASLFSHDIGSFMLLRVLQGMGLCFISAVGYATIQEAFAERMAVRVTALMANVALIAPLVGPLAGAAVLSLWSWRISFVVIAISATLSFIGLLVSMPETIARPRKAVDLRLIGRDYARVLGNRRFLALSVCIPLLAMPVLGWIALSPVILMTQAGMSVMAYGFWQLPVFGGLIAGNLLLARLSSRRPLGHTIVLGRVPLLAGSLLIACGCLLPDQAHYFLIAGTSLIALSEGLAFAVLYRFALMASPVAKGCVAACMTMLSLLAYTLGVELLKEAYLRVGYGGFAALTLLCSLAFYLLSRPLVGNEMAERAQVGLLAQEAA